jgi:dipeptide/tripeptide permease
VVMIADLTKGTGRFNLMQGTVVTAVGVGSALSDYLTGLIVNYYNYHAGFLFLAGMGMAGLLFFYFLVPETRNIRTAITKDIGQ